MEPTPTPSASHNARAFRPEWAWTGEAFVRAPVLTVDADGRLIPHGGEPIEDLPGLVTPGLVNAHTHLELGAFPFERGGGFLSWLTQLKLAPPASASTAGQGIYSSMRAGTCAVGEITNTLLSAPLLSAARMPAQIFHEAIGIDAPTPPASAYRTVPHALHTTHPDVVRACVAADHAWSIHFDEDVEEGKFLHDDGAWPSLLRQFGRDLTSFEFPHCSPTRYLHALGGLTPKTLLVHAANTRGADLDLIAAQGPTICVCVRSNQYITGVLPDVYGIHDRGIPLTIGTDSLGSSPDLDVLAEAATVRALFPKLPAETLLAAITRRAAVALDLPLGTLTLGTSPGLLHIRTEGVAADVLFNGVAWRRRWLSCPSV